MFKRALAVVTAATNPTPTDRLRKAKAARTAAQAKLEKEKAAARRVEALVNDAKVAARSARKAHAAARQAVIEWSAAGADPAGRTHLETLEGEAAAADQLADRAENTAQAARAGFPAVEERVRLAETAPHDRGFDVSEAAESILLAEVGPQLAAVERAAAAYADALPAIRALLRVTRSGTTRQRIRETLGRSEIPSLLDCEVTGRYQYGDPLPGDVLALVGPLENRICELRQDPLPRVLRELAEERALSGGPE